MNSVAATLTQPCNGWSNRETWLANLWLNQNEWSYRVLDNALHQDGEVYTKAEWLEERLRLQLDDEIETACLWQDLLCTAFERISWIEIVERNLE